MTTLEKIELAVRKTAAKAESAYAISYWLDILAAEIARLVKDERENQINNEIDRA